MVVVYLSHNTTCMTECATLLVCPYVVKERCK
jgi:hypothetical protein